METRIKSSFIPRTGVVGRPEERSKPSSFYYLSIFVFILSLVAWGALSVYTKMLQGDIDNLKSQITTTRSSLNDSSTDELMAFDNKLKSVKEIINGHVAISQFFDMLEQNTVSQVAFESLEYKYSGDKVIVALSGFASGYATIALQEETFLKSPSVLMVNFEDLLLDKDTGKVSFRLKGEFNKDLVKFKVPDDYVPASVMSQAAAASTTTASLDEDLGSLPPIEDL